MTPKQFEAVVTEANLAPSTHNTQPVLWSGEDGAVMLSLNSSHALTVGDPTGRDGRLSGGAALLGTRYALARAGIGVEAVEIDGNAARLVLGGEAEQPPDAGLLGARTSYRRIFGAASSQQKAALDDCIATRDDGILVTDRTQIGALSELNDAASLSVMRDRAFRAELLDWMRLSPRDPRWSKDGLSADALGMSRFEASAAGIALRPWAFSTLDALGLTKGIVSEDDRTMSATGLVAIHRPQQEDRWTTGIAFYDLWLNLTAAGFAAWPMAVLADVPDAYEAVTAMLGLPDERSLITVLRVGPHPGAAQPPKARRPAAEMIKAA